MELSSSKGKLREDGVLEEERDNPSSSDSDADSPSSHNVDTSDEEDNGLRIQVDDRTVLLRDHIAEAKKKSAPDYHPIEVVVSHLTCTVKAPPPQKTQTTVATQLNCIAQAKKKKEPIDLIHDLNFYLKPGQMTLLLGAPGCGKSTLLKILASRHKAGKKTGTILFNGKDPSHGNYHRSVSFIPQQDTHIAQLTVKETLRFSAECQMGSWLSGKDKESRVDSILQVLGLSHRAKTVVGDALLRGVSGGEKKRVTIGVEAVKDASIMLMDEPTTGLDSSASYHVLRTVRLLADMKATVLAALLQPSYEVFSLFDNVLILTQGEVAFFGTRQEAMDHFTSLGYSCSENTNPAEFLQEVAESGAGTVANPFKYRADASEDEESGGDDFHWLTPSEFVEAYKKSDYHDRTMKEIEKMTSSSSSSSSSSLSSSEDELSNGHTSSVGQHQEKKYPRSSPRQFLLLAKRAFTKEWRDMTTNRSRVFSAFLISLVTGTLFLRIGNHQDDARTKLGLMFTIMAYFSFSALNALPSIIADRAVYYYQRDSKYYKPLPYLLSNILAEIPMTVLETLIFCSITYWMTGLNSDGDRFIYFLLVCGAYYFMTRAFNRFIACIAPDLNAAQGISPVFTALSVLFGGYMITRTQIPGWWIWFYWMNPAIYGFQSLVANEFWDTHYTCSPDELSPPADTANFNTPYPLGFGGHQTCKITSGTDYAVNQFDVWDYSWIKWVFLAVICCYWLIWTFLAFLALRFVRHLPPPPPRMREKETGDTELEEVNIQDIKKAAAAAKRMNKKGHKNKHEKADNGAYLSWSNLNYSVFVRKGLKKRELQLLHDVSGYVKPGMMLALMGSSGAGKSTLMDVLARRKTGGKITGDVLINGRKADSSLNRIIGYVEQQDIHNPTQTVLEALEFSAICRLPDSIPREKKLQYARSLLTILGLEKQADMVIGSSVQDGISSDQRKRVTMGVEMAADPAILFLDEPTSGLDSFGAERVMKAVQNIAARGTPVVCTIHQPSATIFGLFTHLLLLKKGGYTTYFGPIGEKPGDYSIMLDYFSNALGRQLKPFQNPAEFILEVTGSGISAKKAEGEAGADEPKTDNGDVAVDAFRESNFNKETQELLERGIYPINAENEDSSGRLRKKWRQMKDKMQGRYATPFYVQLWELIKRSFLQYWRTPPDFMAKVLAPLLMGTIMGTLFLQLDNDQVGTTERAACIYFSLIICDLTSMPLLPRVVLDRAVFYRENASRTYNSMAYAITTIVVEWPFCLLATILYVIPCYFITGFQYDAGKFWIFFAVMLLNFLVSVALVQSLALLAPNMILANSLCAIAFTVFALFSGFLISRDNIPDYWIWMHYLDLNMYPLEILVANEMDGLNVHCSGSEYVQVPINASVSQPYCPMTNGRDFLDSVGFHKDNMLRDGLVFFGFYLLMLLLVVLFIKFVKHQKR